MATPLSRRGFLRQTLLFSTGLAASRLSALETDTSFTGEGLHLLAMGDFGSKNENQYRVAQRMAAFSRQLSQPVDAVLALGDNFYGKMTPDRFARDFERMYDEDALPCPFFACIGNHDYEKVSYGLKPEPLKYQTQLDYAANFSQSRWKMPAKWYSVVLPSAAKPTLRLLVLDSNYQPGALTPAEKLAQQRWLQAELDAGTKAPWTWLVWHHPLYSETTKRKDNESLIRMLGDYVRHPSVSLLISGHDHNLQHLRVEGFSASFIISGAGGANTYKVSPSARGFSEEVLGFNHFHLNEDRIKAQFIDSEGRCLHAFRRTRDGKVGIVG